MATFRTPKNAPQSGGARLEVPGIYHFNVGHIDEQPSGGGQMLDGFKAQLAVMNGDNSGKTVDQLFRHPSESHKDGGEFCAQVQAAFFIATGLITERDLENPELDIQIDQATTRQIIAKVDFGRGKDGQPTKFLEVVGTHCYHIDDPRVANIPRNMQAIGLLPKSHRREPGSFDMVKLTGKPDIKLLDPNAGGVPAEQGSKSKANGHGANGNGSHAKQGSQSGQSSQQKQTAPVAPAGEADLDNL